MQKVSNRDVARAVEAKFKDRTVEGLRRSYNPFRRLIEATGWAPIRIYEKGQLRKPVGDLEIKLGTHLSVRHRREERQKLDMLANLIARGLRIKKMPQVSRRS